MLQYKDSSGVLASDDLTGETVTFTMVNAATGVVKVAETSTGVTASTGGSVTYQPVAGDVDEVGIFHAFFEHTNGGATDTFPAVRTDFKISINSKTQSGQEAYEAAVT